MAKQGSSKKHGRGRDRPSNKRYTHEARWLKNKEKNIKRDLRIKAKARARKTMRAARKLVAMPPGQVGAAA